MVNSLKKDQDVLVICYKFNIRIIKKIEWNKLFHTILKIAE